MASAGASGRSVGVVGAGISGLVAAARLQARSDVREVTVLEWGRGPGGRTARRRATVEDDESTPFNRGGPLEVSFDHGAPFFEARSALFRRELLDKWIDDGWAQQWKASTRVRAADGDDAGVSRLSRIGDGAVPAVRSDDQQGDAELFVGTPSNNAICKGLVEELVAAGGRTLFGRHVRKARFEGKCGAPSEDTNTTADHEAGVWRVTATKRSGDNREEEEVEEYAFDALVLSDKLLLLPNQYAVLGEAEGRALLGLQDAETPPAPPEASPGPASSRAQLVLMLAFWPPLQGVEEDVVWVAGSEGAGEGGEEAVLELVVRDSRKPGRAAAPDLWVVRSTSAYALRELAPASLSSDAGPALRDERRVREEMLEAFGRLLGVGDRRPLYSASVFPWDHARPMRQVAAGGAAFSLDAGRRLGACGDFFAAGVGRAPLEGVEAAAVSGWQLGEALGELLLQPARGD